MKKNFVSILYAFLVFGVKAQSPSLDWAKSYLGTTNTSNSGNSVAVDYLGNVITIGTFTTTVDFDPSATGVANLTSNGQIDIFIAKTDSQGNYLWAKQIGGSGFDEPLDVAVDSIGNIYFTGYFTDSADFNTGIGTLYLKSKGLRDLFVCKLGTDGIIHWANSIGGINCVSTPYSLTLDNENNVYVGGSYTGKADFNPSPFIKDTFFMKSTSSYDIFLFKLKSNGAFKWAKTMGSNPGYDEIYGMKTDLDNNLFITGAFQGTMDFDPGTNIDSRTSSGGDDIFISKLDSSGNFLWTKTIGNSGNDVSRALEIDKDKNIISTGYFSNTVDFDPSTNNFDLISAGGSDIFVSKLDSLGNFLWAKNVGGTTYNQARKITLDSYGDIYCTGKYAGTVDFDPGTGVSNLTSNAFDDVFILKLNSAGSYVWATGFGGASTDVGYGIKTDFQDKLITVGFYQKTTDFDPSPNVFNLTSVGTAIFIQKLGVIALCGDKDNNGQINGNEILGDANLDLIINGSEIAGDKNCNGTIDGIEADGDANNNQIGLDCSDRTILQLSPINTNVSLSNFVLTAGESGALYQWIDCNNSDSIIIGETSQNFNVNTNGSYAVTIKLGNCTDTSVCNTISNVGISILQNENETFVLYPNPTNEFITLISNLPYQTTYEIINPLGQVVSNGSIDTKKIISLSKSENGLYILKIYNKQKTNYIKIIKN